MALFTLSVRSGGGLATFALEWYSAVYDYPINVGGRPLMSWPAFLPPAIEMTLPGAAVFGIIAMLMESRLPRLYHPLFVSKDSNAAAAIAFSAAERARTEVRRARGARIPRVLVAAIGGRDEP